MGDLFPAGTFSPAVVVGYAADLMSGTLGMLFLTIVIGPTVAGIGFLLLRDALEERRFRQTQHSKADWILYNNFVEHYTKTGGYKLDRDSQRWVKQMNLRKAHLAQIESQNTRRRVAAQSKAGKFINSYGLPTSSSSRRSSGGSYGKRRSGGGSYGKRRRSYGGY